MYTLLWNVLFTVLWNVLLFLFGFESRCILLLLQDHGVLCPNYVHYNYGVAVIDPIMCNTDQGSVQMSDTHGSIGGQPLGQPVVPIA